MLAINPIIKADIELPIFIALIAIASPVGNTVSISKSVKIGIAGVKKTPNKKLTIIKDISIKVLSSVQIRTLIPFKIAILATPIIINAL